MATKDQLAYTAETRTVQDLVKLFQNEHLNLEPEFQRDSVWSDRDRTKLIDSVFRTDPKMQAKEYFESQPCDVGYIH